MRGARECGIRLGNCGTAYPFLLPSGGGYGQPPEITALQLSDPTESSVASLPVLIEHNAEAKNVSSRGLYFPTKFPFLLGERVDVLLTMPAQVTGRPARDWVCHGRIVRTERDDAAGTAAIAVEFLYHEFMRNKTRRSASEGRYGWSVWQDAAHSQR